MMSMMLFVKTQPHAGDHSTGCLSSTWNRAPHLSMAVERLIREQVRKTLAETTRNVSGQLLGQARHLLSLVIYTARTLSTARFLLISLALALPEGVALEAPAAVHFCNVCCNTRQACRQRLDADSQAWKGLTSQGRALVDTQRDRRS
eukprot:4606892-Amphidinium_carterae.1